MPTVELSNLLERLPIDRFAKQYNNSKKEHLIKMNLETIKTDIAIEDGDTYHDNYRANETSLNDLNTAIQSGFDGIRDNFTHKIRIVDPDGCEDADDSFSVYIEEDKIKLAIHIADPTHHIKVGSKVLEKIKDMTQTLYFPDKANDPVSMSGQVEDHLKGTIHMMPPSKVEDITLNKHDKRKNAVTIIININDDGSINIDDVHDVNDGTLRGFNVNQEQYEVKLTQFTIHENLSNRSYRETGEIISNDNTFKREIGEIDRLFKDYYESVLKNHMSRNYIIRDVQTKIKEAIEKYKPQLNTEGDNYGEDDNENLTDLKIAILISKLFKVHSLKYENELSKTVFYSEPHHDDFTGILKKTIEEFALLGNNCLSNYLINYKSRWNSDNDDESNHFPILINRGLVEVANKESIKYYEDEGNEHHYIGMINYSHFTSPMRRYADLYNHYLIKLSLLNDDDQKIMFINLFKECIYESDLEKMRNMIERINEVTTFTNSKHFNENTFHNYQELMKLYNNPELLTGITKGEVKKVYKGLIKPEQFTENGDLKDLNSIPEDSVIFKTIKVKYYYNYYRDEELICSFLLNDENLSLFSREVDRSLSKKHFIIKNDTIIKWLNENIKDRTSILKILNISIEYVDKKEFITVTLNDTNFTALKEIIDDQHRKLLDESADKTKELYSKESNKGSSKFNFKEFVPQSQPQKEKEPVVEYTPETSYEQGFTPYYGQAFAPDYGQASAPYLQQQQQYYPVEYNEDTGFIYYETKSIGKVDPNTWEVEYLHRIIGHLDMIGDQYYFVPHYAPQYGGKRKLPKNIKKGTKKHKAQKHINRLTKKNKNTKKTKKNKNKKMTKKNNKNKNTKKSKK